MATFEERRAARIERLRARAERKRQESATLLEQGHRMFDIIPPGQPILVGHYSEKADRNYRERAGNKITKGYEALDEAKELEHRAKSAERNRAIFSDDPTATDRLEDKIARLEARQDLMREANRLVRKQDREGLAALGFSEERIYQLLNKPDFLGRLGFASGLLTNNAANIRRLRERLKTLQVHAAESETETETNGVRMVDNVEENRLQLFFPDKPTDSIRSALKAHGFRWTPTLGCWQAYRGQNATYWAEQILSTGKEQNP